MADAPRISFPCPKCDKSLSIAVRHAGKRGKCPGCGGVIQIPTVRPAQLAVSTGPAPTPKPDLFGVTDPICPYCGHRLEKMPGRKKKCPACRNDIFVRTRPQDRARILVRSDQLLAIEEQWAITNGTHQEFLATQQRRQNVVAQLRSRFGREPSENDIDWALLNDNVLTYAQEGDWGLYRNARFAMAEILSKEKKFSQALDFLLEVCYLDLNGPSNCGSITDPQLLREFPPFDPTAGYLAPGVIGRIHDMIETLQQSSKQIESRFMVIANQLAQSLKLPLLPEKAWRKLDREVNND